MPEQPNVQSAEDRIGAPVRRNFQHAAESDKAAGGVIKRIDAVTETIKRLDTDLGNARHLKLRLEQERDEHLKNAAGFRRAAYVVGDDDKLTEAQLVAADQAAQAAAAEPEAPAEALRWRTDTCSGCLTMITEDPDREVWGHPHNNSTVCYPDRPDSPVAQPMSADPLRSGVPNGQYPAPSGAAT